ncbi:MAG: hypothetical protein ACD_38C00047G0019 [uncultured bacterium]|uniref:Uncharacterized protein n=2 Tax=Microgenomates group TaxID=1794810 RepID=A0A0G0T412_9BACT|nr:MAG: hypothetical protein ACD_38C00047G0019 [uncultured bacterium]KKQ75797.1 MAG: hypothetical protein US96_C0004G0020 [Candidatus Woesebacteria bacterium GW2011_GWB1_38_5b]KKR16570.1 MAG: hypothetical protein UT45_C0005G0099 [Candidatus Daviesbacteria bacterium GW2011_GWA2_39_33]KKR41835.1 MAG: hypothetical protein UT77_C0006G0067 [Candidatus Daviesbacteria bacterium GW2011_GWC2_40_12]
MMRIELANGTKIKLPPGNKWTLEGSIPRLEAGGVKYPYKIIDLSKASPPMQRVVQVMQNQFLQPEWQFVAMFGWEERLMDIVYLHTIFVNPLRKALTRRCPPLDFARLKQIAGERKPADNDTNGIGIVYFKKEPVQVALMGTNFEPVSNISASYYNFHGYIKDGWFRRIRYARIFSAGVLDLHTKLAFKPDERINNPQKLFE